MKDLGPLWLTVILAVVFFPFWWAYERLWVDHDALLRRRG